VNVGFAAGDFALADTLPEGNYHIRAYTNLMRNFEPGCFFNKSISVVNPFPKEIKTGGAIKSIPPPSQNNIQADDIQFFPEGGQLVSGLKSTVGFKAIAPNGLGIAINGKLVDNQGHVVLEFQSAHAGMGAFTFTPVAGNSYTAIIKLPNRQERRLALPAALSSGYVLLADNSKPDSLYITLQATPDLVNKADLTFMPIANGAPLFFMNTKFPDRQISITAPKNKLPGGIIQLTLLNAQNQPVAQRLVFNNYRQQVTIGISQMKTTYAKREKVEYDLQALDASGKPAIGSFSIAVTNADAVEPNELTETTIFSNLLLSADLKGYTENPNYYFTDASPAKNIELDNLMLTQGWRRFTWTDLATAQWPKLTYPIEDKISVSGKITGTGKTNINGVPITLLAGQLGNGLLLDTVTNEQGQFKFNVTDSLAGLPIRIQAKPKRAAEYDLALDNYLSPAIDNEQQVALVQNTPDTLKTSSPAAIIKYGNTIAAHIKASGNASIFGKSTRLKEVVIKDYKHKELLPNSHSVNLNGPGGADVVILPETLEKMPDLSYIDVLLPGTVVTPDKRLVLRSITGTHTPGVLILIDGVNAGPDALTSISPTNVESIEFMKTPAYAGVYGIRGSGGVLIITTKRGGIDKSILTAKAPNSISFKLPLYLKKEFYSPRYDHPERAPKLADQRTTVYWKPDVITNKDGRASVCFYNTDVPGNYRVVIEGISSKGYLCRQVYNYKVE
jgi:hypothetical protein